MTHDSLDGDLAVSTNEAVAFGFTLSNAADEPVELRFRTGQAAEFVVVEDGTEVWRWSAGRMFTQALWSERLGPGESATYEATWHDPEPGAYEAVATLAATNADVEARARFEV